MEKSGNPPLASLSGIRECIQTAAKGACLFISQLEDMEKSLVVVMWLKNYLSRCKQWEISLAYYDENLDCLDHLKETICMQIRNSRIDDDLVKVSSRTIISLEKGQYNPSVLLAHDLVKIFGLKIEELFNFEED